MLCMLHSQLLKIYLLIEMNKLFKILEKCITPTLTFNTHL